MRSLDVEATRQRLAVANGGYEVVHRSPGLEVGVYVLVAPEPDRRMRTTRSTSCSRAVAC